MSKSFFLTVEVDKSRFEDKILKGQQKREMVFSVLSMVLIKDLKSFIIWTNFPEIG